MLRGLKTLQLQTLCIGRAQCRILTTSVTEETGKNHLSFLHPDLEGILKNTYGIIVFQEQLIEIGRLAKIHNPDLLRKATGKKNPKLLNEVKPELEENLKARRMDARSIRYALG